jgi:branched-chain amino acid transport system ATP-binding protein
MIPDDRILAISDLGLLFGGVSAIETLSISVKRGSRTAIVGPNGAGKTTLFNLLSGVYSPTHGSIVLDGRDLLNAPLAKRAHAGIGRTFQNLRLMKHLTVLENVMLGQHHRTCTAAMFVPLVSRCNRVGVDEALKAIYAVGLQTEANRLAEGLSYGMLKRVELARALVTKPKLLLLDEPTAGLNTAERSQLLSALKGAVGLDVTILLIEHDLNFVGGICDHVVVLHFGRKIAEGSLEEIRHNKAVIEAYLGTGRRAREASCAA